MTIRSRHLPLALAALAAAALAAGCGSEGDERLDESTAQRLIRELDEVDRRVAEGECAAARRGSLVRLERSVDSLPEESREVRAALEDGLARLSDLIDAQCEDEDTETQTETTPTETEPPAETETAPPPPPETQPETQTAPDDEEDGGGGQTAPEEETPPGEEGFPPGQERRQGGGGQGIVE